VDGRPLHRLLAARYRNGEVDGDVFVYAAGGYYHPGKDVTKLQDEMRSYLASGYEVVKMKIGGEDFRSDLRRIEVVAWAPM
jgi:D(-)-tartrate dehydratase